MGVMPFFLEGGGGGVAQPVSMPTR